MGIPRRLGGGGFIAGIAGIARIVGRSVEKHLKMSVVGSRLSVAHPSPVSQIWVASSRARQRRPDALLSFIHMNASRQIPAMSPVMSLGDVTGDSQLSCQHRGMFWWILAQAHSTDDLAAI